jgi:hypothetical protein
MPQGTIGCAGGAFMSEHDPSPFRQERTAGGYRFGFDLRAATVAGQLKTASFAGFEFRCDESERLGGSNSAPPPLAYFAAAVAF